MANIFATRGLVPSQVVAYIDARVEEAKKQDLGSGGEYKLGSDRAPFVRGLIEMVEAVPSHLLILDGNEYALFVEAMAHLRDGVERWKNIPHHRVSFLLDSGRTNPLTQVRRALAACPDEAPAPGTVELVFVTDVDLRESLRRDVGAADQALRNGEWKAATVLAGSVVEALLLWALNDLDARDSEAVENAVTAAMGGGSLDNKPQSDRTRWGLHELTQVAREASLVSEETAQQCDLARNFRNLINVRIRRFRRKLLLNPR